jgi:hypothetical protein
MWTHYTILRATPFKLSARPAQRANQNIIMNNHICILIAASPQSKLEFEPSKKGFEMEELQAKWTFDQGGFAKAMIVPTPMGAGYHLHLVKFGRLNETLVLERQRGGWRVFKTIDAAANTANNIGFRRIEVDLSNR